MFFNTSQVTKEKYEPEDENQWKIGILDLERKDPKNGPLATHHYKNSESFTRINAIEKDIID